MFALDDVAFLGSLSTYDPDALAYIRAVEIADTQEPEPGVRTAINDFVIGCKTDNIWSALKATCILAGARTLAGALVPLVGAAPTNFNFVAGDYNRKTGLIGNGSTKYLDSNRNNNADPQDNNHNACFISTATSTTGGYMGTSSSFIGHNNIFVDPLSPAIGLFMRSRSTTLFTAAPVTTIGFAGHSRNTGQAFAARAQGTTLTATRDSGAPVSENINIFKRGVQHVNARLAFYSIGESLDLALLDARVTALLAAIDAAI